MPENSHIILYFFPHPHPYILANPFTWPGDFPSSLLTGLKFFFCISGSRKPVKIFNPQNNACGVFFFTEALAPLIVGTQNQFNFSHITAGATAMGKVQCTCTFPLLDYYGDPSAGRNVYTHPLWYLQLVEALSCTVSDHLGISEKWSQLELFAYEHELS